MVLNVEAVYENGVLRPLEPLGLSESQRVRLVVSTGMEGRSERDWGAVERARAEVAAAGRIPSIEEVRAALAVIPGSMAQVVIDERGEF
jgi:predicted DNA-binding antitoxin AbrB/MazE fold protein